MNESNKIMQPLTCASHAKLSESVALLNQKADTTNVDVKKVLTLLQGNGGKGLVTDIELVKDKIHRVWWWLSAVSLGILSIAFMVIKKGL